MKSTNRMLSSWQQAVDTLVVSVQARRSVLGTVALADSITIPYSYAAPKAGSGDGTPCMPQATHALLLTDVVDSTKLAEELGDEKVAQLWAAHDRLARDLLQPHNGREIDKTDGFLLLFDEVKDAVAYALAYHAALRDIDLQARAGLHVGHVVLRENPAKDIARGAKPLEVEGIAKPTAARVMSLARGGQTLCTSEAIEALEVKRAAHGPYGRAKGEDLLAVTHGHWMLKGLLHPQELFEVGVSGKAPFVPPPDAEKAWRVQWKNKAWVPVKQVKHCLPAERNAFVGRSKDLRELAHRLDEGARLVSVLGVGGSGKTRLVTHFGWTWLGSFPGGVWFCDLSEARSEDGIAYAVARALDVPLGKEPLVQLGHAIAGRRRCLIILDNFEQVARHARETLGHWLDRAADAQFVVTTREVLGLPGEKALALAPLSSSEGARLFIERAQDAKRDFVADDTASIESLVTLLDGLPLAIELAAARVRLMAPKVLLARMSQRFKLLTSAGGRRDRQATLRGALDWSWDLLSEDEQAALVQLSVFEGGFELEALAGVLDLKELWPEDAAQALLNKSLVRRVSDERLDLLVSVQEYAAEKLEALGQREATQERHGLYFAEFGSEEALQSLDVQGGVTRRLALSAELDNLLAATRRAVTREDGETATATLKAAWVLLKLRGPFVLAVDLATEALKLSGLAQSTRAALAHLLGQALIRSGRGSEARVYYDEALLIARELNDRRSEGLVLGNLGILHMEQGLMEEARAHFDEALSIAREVGDRHSEGNVRGSLGILHKKLGRPQEARAHYDEALLIQREVGDRASEGVVLGNLGILHEMLGQMEEARAQLGEALLIAREVGNRRSEGLVLGNLGLLHMGYGLMEEARAHYDEALLIAREVGNRASESVVLGNLSTLHMGQGQLDEARARYDKALWIAREVGNRRFEGVVLGNLGVLHMEQGLMEEARAHYDTALSIHREVGNRRFEGGVLRYLGMLHMKLGQREEARGTFDACEVLLRTVQDAEELAKLLCCRARLEHAEGQAEAARTALDEAEALAERADVGGDSDLGKELAKARTALEMR